MGWTGYSPEQIITMLREAEVHLSLCHKYVT